jgi:hypothetical protein
MILGEMHFSKGIAARVYAYARVLRRFDTPVRDPILRGIDR